MAKVPDIALLEDIVLPLSVQTPKPCASPDFETCFLIRKIRKMSEKKEKEKKKQTNMKYQSMQKNEGSH